MGRIRAAAVASRITGANVPPVGREVRFVPAVAPRTRRASLSLSALRMISSWRTRASAMMESFMPVTTDAAP